MTMRLLLVRHPGTATTRHGYVPDDEPAVGPLPSEVLAAGRLRVVTSPARRCRAPGGEVDPRLSQWNLARWRGCRLADLDPDALARWRADPTFAEHGGESLNELLWRVADLLDDWRSAAAGPSNERVVLVTHAAVIKAAVVTALCAPASAVWDVDVHPASLTELHGQARGWRVTYVNRRSDRTPSVAD